jgi:expansin (peptidoglycan-binding protein)
MHYWEILIGLAIAPVACSNKDAATSSSGDGSNWNVSTNPTTTVELGQQRTGEATYYDFANGDGACMFGPSPNDMNVAALNAPDYSSAAWCGACADVTGPNGSVRVRIVDECPECPSGNLDLSPQAFQQIAELAQGRVSITWSFVACDVTGPVKYKYKDGSNPWWTAVQVSNHRLPITKFEWSADGTQFTEMPRQDYNYFLAASGFGPNSVTVRITAIDGQTLTDTLPAVQELLVVDGHAQFQ